MDILESHATEEDERTRYLIQVAQATSEQRMIFPLARITTCGTLTIQILQAIRVRADGQQEAIYGPPDPAVLAEKRASTAFTFLDLFQRKGTSASDRVRTREARQDAVAHALRMVTVPDAQGWFRHCSSFPQAGG